MEPWLIGRKWTSFPRVGKCFQSFTPVALLHDSDTFFLTFTSEGDHASVKIFPALLLKSRLATTTSWCSIEWNDDLGPRLTGKQLNLWKRKRFLRRKSGKTKPILGGRNFCRWASESNPLFEGMEASKKSAFASCEAETRMRLHWVYSEL